GNQGSILKLTFFLILSISASTLFAQPVINSVAPKSGPVGSAVTIAGSNFSATPANNIVYFGTAMATVTSASSTALQVMVPTGASYQNISVTTGGLTGYS